MKKLNLIKSLLLLNPVPHLPSFLVIINIRGMFNKFPDFFVQAFKIVVDS